MKKFHNFIRNFKIPNKKEIISSFSYFSKREFLVFISFAVIFIFSTLAILQQFNKMLMVSVPAHGGTISEGMVGTPRFINPILAFGDADQGLTALIYSGLMRKDENANLVPDLAESYEISKNGLVYTFILKDKLYFHDDTPLTIKDIIFTINKVKDSVIKSPQRINWDGVSVEEVDDKTIKFTLKQPFASFLENTTLGILPAHIWEGSPVELNDANINPIGSGPYMIKNLNKQSSGIIDYYELVPFKKFVLGEAYIKNLNLHFYLNEEEMIKGLKDGTITQTSSITPTNANILKEKEYTIETSILPRVFGLFFNQNNNHIFLDKTVLKAINQTINKDKIVEEVLGGYGTIVDDPIPPNMVDYQKLNRADTLGREEKLKNISESLAKAGWKKDSLGVLEKIVKEKKKTTTTKLEFSIFTGNVAELSKTAELIQKDLWDIGIKVNIKTFEVGDLNQNIIRPRKYEALLFGEIINHESDLFAFWHSSQIKDPGLNVAIYTNAKVDKILEDAFVSTDKQVRIKKYLQFEEEIRKDIPAVFLYSPEFIYVVDKNLQNFKTKETILPKDRYSNVYKWYIDTENVWKIFAPK
jgi:peptide/nickel transport system substrate-binding protein